MMPFGLGPIESLTVSDITFRSLFSWMMPFGTEASVRELTRIEEFRSLFSWMMPFRHAEDHSHGDRGKVSILVLLDDALRPTAPASGYASRCASFDPCSPG